MCETEGGIIVVFCEIFIPMPAYCVLSSSRVVDFFTELRALDIRHVDQGKNNRV